VDLHAPPTGACRNDDCDHGRGGPVEPCVCGTTQYASLRSRASGGAAMASSVQPEHHHRASTCSIQVTAVKPTLLDADVIVSVPQ
jgi:hypothetical protein